MKKNSFEKMCDELESTQNCYKYDEVVCAIIHLFKYCKGDRNRLLQIKAEAKQTSYQELVSFVFNGISFFATVSTLFVAGITLIATIDSTPFKDGIKDLKLYAAVIFLAIVFFSVYALIRFIYFKNTNKWREFILVAIEELERNNYGNKNK